MCGRFTDLYTWQQIYEYYSLIGETPANWGPSYNVCPTDPVGVITLRDGQRRHERLRWGLVPYWWSKPLKELRLATFNARAETVDTKPFFREAFRRRRCLIPVSGYYEWQYRDGPKKPPQPWYFTPADGAPVLTTAGLWDEWRDKKSGETIRSATMIITGPNRLVAEVHDRMPVLLRPEQFDSWLDGSAGKEVLLPAPDDMLQKHAVSKRVNSSKAPKEDATLIEAVEVVA